MGGAGFPAPGMLLQILCDQDEHRPNDQVHQRSHQGLPPVEGVFGGLFRCPFSFAQAIYLLSVIIITLIRVNVNRKQRYF